MQFNITSGRQGRPSGAAAIAGIVGGALVMSALSAHASIGVPSSGSSDAVLFAEVVAGNGSVVAAYVGDTGVSISSLAGGSSGSKTALTGDANLSALFAADKLGDTLYWAVQGGQYTGGNTSATNFKTPGVAQFVTTVTGNDGTALPGYGTGNLTSWGAGFNNDVPNINLNIANATVANGYSVEASSVAAAGFWDVNAVGANLSSWYNNGPLTFNTTPSAALYYVTGGGTKTGPVDSSTIDTVSLTANGLQISPGGPSPDSYSLSTHVLTIPTLGIGSATYSNVTVSVESIVTGPSGSSPNGTEDTYDPSSNYLTVQSVMVGSGTFYNPVVKVSPAAATTSIGSVIGADTYSGGQLAISEVQVGSHTYSNCIITVSGIVSLQGGLPQNALDVYEPAVGELLVAAATFNGKVYTNVTVKVGTILQVNGNPFAAVNTELANINADQAVGKSAVATNDNLRFRQ